MGEQEASVCFGGGSGREVGSGHKEGCYKYEHQILPPEVWHTFFPPYIPQTYASNRAVSLILRRPPDCSITTTIAYSAHLYCVAG